VRAIWKELLVGLANGIAIGAITGLIVGLWTGQWVLAGILLLAMCGNLVIAGVAGGLVPLVLERYEFDPAVASSIFVTTFTDTGGFFLFLGMATLAMRSGFLCELPVNDTVAAAFLSQPSLNEHASVCQETKRVFLRMRLSEVKLRLFNDLAQFAQLCVQRAENRDFLRVAAFFTAFSAAFSTLSV
jgi:hypothetical protein